MMHLEGKMAYSHYCQPADCSCMMQVNLHELVCCLDSMGKKTSCSSTFGQNVVLCCQLYL